jgi:hypothetical protein
VEKRICPLCNIEPEDGMHFILKCPKLDECRKELFSNISSVVPSFNDIDEFQKFKFILNSNDLDICKICILGVNKLYSINKDLKGKLLLNLYAKLLLQYIQKYLNILKYIE